MYNCEFVIEASQEPKYKQDGYVDKYNCFISQNFSEQSEDGWISLILKGSYNSVWSLT